MTRAAAAGDYDAFSRIYEESFPYVWGFAARCTRRRPAAEALADQIFQRLYAELDSYAGDVPFAAWLHRLAKRVAAEERRRAAHASRRRPLSA